MEDQGEDKVKAMYGETPPADVSLPDLLVPPPPQQKEEKKEIKDEVDVSFNFAFMGAGQGGSRIAESFHKLGYRKLAVLNTAEQDLNTINLENKLLIGSGGAGKDPSAGEEAFGKRREDVLDFMKYSFGDEVDKVFVCAGAGGGTGSGSILPLVETSKELIETLKLKEKNVGVILALPKKSEGKNESINE